MSIATEVTTELSSADPSPSPVAIETVASSAGATSKKKFGLSFWVAVGWLTLVVFCAIFGSLLPMVKTVPDYLAGADVGEGGWTRHVTWSHPLSTDAQGNDILSNLIIGSRNSIIIAFATIILGFVIGGILGMVAGYRRGRFDSVASFFITILLSIPPLLFILLLVSVLSAGGGTDGVDQGLQASVWKLAASLGILFIPALFRVVRGATMSFAGREFVVAARAMGAKTGRILMREIFPNVAKPMLAYGLVGAGNVMVIEGGLSFLGVGVNGPAWGRMINSGSSLSDLRVAPHVAFIPAFVLFLTVLCFNFVGDKVRERLEVKEGNI